MASKSYGWDVRNIAKISPKMAEKLIFHFFFDFIRNFLYDSNEIFYSHSTPYYGPLCAISLNSYGWDVRNIAQKWPKKIFDFSIFSKTVHTIKTKFSIVILHHIVLCAMASKSYGWDVRNIAKINPKMAKNSLFSTFLILQKLSIRFERKFLQSFYTILWSFVCNFNKFV